MGACGAGGGMAGCRAKKKPATGQKAGELAMAESKVDVGGWISEAFEAYKANFGLLCVAMLVAVLLSVFTCGVLAGPMMAGMTLLVLRVVRKEQPVPQIGDVFKGFDFFVQALLYIVVLVAAGFVLGFIPMIGQVASYLLLPLVMFGMCLIVDRKMEFWPAIMASFEKAKTEYVMLLVLWLLGSLISAAGGLLCGVGAILTAPFSSVLTVVAYRHLFEGAEAQAIPVVEATPIPPQA